MGLSSLKKILPVLLFIFPLFLWGQDILTTAEREWFLENSPIVLSVDHNNPPMNYLDQNREMQGITMEYMKILEEVLGTEFEYAPDNWSNALQSAMDHRSDGILNASAIDDRLSYLNFTDPYFETPDALLTMGTAEPFSGPDSFSGQVIAVVKGSARLQWFKEYSPEVELMEVHSIYDGLRVVVEGTAHGFLDEMSVILFLSDEYSLLDVKVNTIVLTQGHGASRIGLRNDSEELLSIFNKAIAQIRPEDHRRIREQFQPREYNPEIIINPGFTREEKDWLKNHPVIRVGARSSWAPIEFRRNGEPQGISMDFLRAIEDVLSVEFEIVQASWPELNTMLEQGELDMLSCVQETSQRQSMMNFTQPYISMPMVLLARTEVPFVESLSQIQDKPIGILLDFAATEQIYRQYPHWDFHEYESQEDAITALQNGDIYVLVENQHVINHYLYDKGIYGLQIVGDFPFYYDLSMASRRDLPILVEILEKANMTLNDNHREQIIKDWTYITVRQELDYQTLLWISLGFSALLVGLLIWNRLLSKSHRLKTHALEEARKMEAIGNMAGGIAHDFKNILMGISGYVDLLHDHEFSSEEKETYYQEVFQAIGSGKDLVNRILTYSRGSESSHEVFPLGDMVRDILGIVQRGSSMEVIAELSIEENLSLEGDPVQFRQVFLNLIGNAFHAMEHSPMKKLTIKAMGCPANKAAMFKSGKTKNHCVFLEIRDSGEGIKEKHLEKVFEPYFTTKTRGRGTGLGLANVDKIIRSHGGRIEVQSKPGEGTSFTLYIPQSHY